MRFFFPGSWSCCCRSPAFACSRSARSDIDRPPDESTWSSLLVARAV